MASNDTIAVTYSSELDRLCSTLDLLQIPFVLEIDGFEESVDTAFVSFVFQKGDFVRMVSREPNEMGRGGAFLRWR